MTKFAGHLLVNVTAVANPGGTVSAPDLKAGDRVLQATAASLNGNVNIFEAVVSVDGQVQQFAAPVDLAGTPFEILALRL